MHMGDHVGRRQPSPKRMAVEKSRDRRSRLRAGSTLSAPAEEIAVARVKPPAGRGPSAGVLPARRGRRELRIRSRNPCVLWRRRLLGWKVRLLTAGSTRWGIVGRPPLCTIGAGGSAPRYVRPGRRSKRPVDEPAAQSVGVSWHDTPGSCSGRRHASRNRCAQRLAELAAKLLASAPTEALPRFERQRYRRRPVVWRFAGHRCLRRYLRTVVDDIVDDRSASRTRRVERPPPAPPSGGGPDGPAAQPLTPTTSAACG
jgi:hypothetical protein